ncbi:FxsA protein [Pseudoalteromonas luteoviolacea B = ATCC 29581]|nr:FxsA protein [Pseudoalteromonas luteoviolacea B = ATCC 29581]
MFRILFLLFILVPIIEIALLIQVSDVIGGFATIALVILTAILGAKLVKQQGAHALRAVQGEMARGQMPAKELFDGLCVIIAGVLLLTPGIMTDLLGFLLLTPAIRASLAAQIMKHATVHVAGNFATHSAQYQHSSQENAASTSYTKSSTNTIEGEFERKE